MKVHIPAPPFFHIVCLKPKRFGSECSRRADDDTAAHHIRKPIYKRLSVPVTHYTVTDWVSISGVYLPSWAALVSLALNLKAAWAAGACSAFPPHAFKGAL